MEIGLDGDESQENINGRALRKRPSKPPLVTKRRKNESEQKPSEEITVEELYRQDITKIANFQPTSLETIYESPRGKTNYLKDLMGIVKLKRQCRFSAFYDPPKLKVKQRKNRARSLKRIGLKSSSAKVSLEQVEQALKKISGDEDVENNSSVSNSKLFAKDWCYQGNIIKPDNSFQSVNELTSTLAGMDMSSLNCKGEYDMNTFDPLLFEQIDLKNNININKDGDKKDFDLLFCSPSVIKSKKERRRSGRVPPRVLEEPIMDTSSPPHCNVSSTEPSITECNKIVDYSMESDNFTSSKVVISDYSAITNKVDSHQLLLAKGESENKNEVFGKKISSFRDKRNNANCDANKNKGTIKKSAKAKTLRRTSGIRRPLYHSILNLSNELENSSSSITSEVVTNSEISHSPQRYQPENKTSTSPTCLFNGLKISSPGSVTLVNSKIKKSQRRSARLSSGGLQMGSLWTDCKKSKSDYNSIKEPSDDLTSPIPGTQDYFSSESYQSPPAKILNSTSTVRAKVLQKSNESLTNFVVTDGFSEKVPVNFSEFSPVVSGMFDSKARIIKGKKFITQESHCSFNLNPFKPARL